MKKTVKKAGIATMAAVAATGMAFGAASVVTNAAELGETEILENAATQSSALTVDEARAAADDAREQAQAAADEAAQAQETAAEAQKAADAADSDLLTAKSDAVLAFEKAVAGAQEQDDDAAEELKAAEEAAASAAKAEEAAREQAQAAEDVLSSAEDEYEKAKEDSGVTQDMINDAEEHVSAARDELADAEETVRDAEQDLRAAETAVADAEMKSAAADKDTENAQAEFDSAEGDINKAQDVCDKASADLEYVAGLKGGTVSIEDTEQYRAEQQSRQDLESLEDAALKAAEDVERAKQDLAGAASNEEVAKAALSGAVTEVQKAKAALEAASQETEQAALREKDAKEAVLEAESVQSAAAESHEIAKADKAEAEQAAADAERRQEDAENAVTEAMKALEKAETEAAARVDSDIAAASQEAEAKEQVENAAKDALEAVAENYNQGTLGFIDWMLAKDDLSKDQQQDLQFARDIIVAASEEDFTNWYGGDRTGFPESRNGKVISIGDEYDATNLENLLKSIEIMKKINELRSSDDNYTGDMQRNASYTNFYFMAVAEAGAMRGAGLLRHSSLIVSCEDLAFGYSDPTVGWYTSEKAIFDRIKGELGIDTITSASDVKAIETEATKQGLVVGHYTNLFWAEDQVMGVGYTPYKKTSCYNASKASNYTNDQYNRAMHMYTIEEFETLARKYYATVDKSELEKAVEVADAERQEAEDKLNELTAGREAAIENAVSGTRNELNEKQNAYEAAVRVFAEASEALASANASAQNAEKTYETATEALARANERLSLAAAGVLAAEENEANAEREYQDAEVELAGAKKVMEAAAAARTEAQDNLTASEDKLSSTDENLVAATIKHEEALNALAALTSDDAIETLKTIRDDAVEALKKAQVIASQKKIALEQAQIRSQQAWTELAAARAELDAATSALEERTAARSEAQDKLDMLSDQLEEYVSRYAPVLQAEAARDAAQEARIVATSELAEAEGVLSTASEKLLAAHLKKSHTYDNLDYVYGMTWKNAAENGIDNEDFEYLISYVDRIKEAEANVTAARIQFEEAISELADKQEASNAAAQKYAEAAANLAIAETLAAVDSIRPNNTIDPVVKDGSVVYEPIIQTPDLARREDVVVAVKEPTGVENGSSSKATSANKADMPVYEIRSGSPVATGDANSVWPYAVTFASAAGIGAAAIAGRKRRKEQ